MLVDATATLRTCALRIAHIGLMRAGDYLYACFVPCLGAAEGLKGVEILICRTGILAKATPLATATVTLLLQHYCCCNEHCFEA